MEDSGIDLTLLDAVPYGICLTTNKFVVQMWNKTIEQWSGLARDEVVGKDLLILYPHLAEQRYLGRMRMTVQGGPPQVFSPQLHPTFIPAPLPGGGHRYLQTTVSAVPLPEQRQPGVLIALADMTLVVAQLQEITDLRNKALERDKERDRLIAQLQEALAKIKTLRGMLPICASCKKIRDDKGYWHKVEQYISEQTGAAFSHGYCPECLEKMVKELRSSRFTRSE